MIILTEAAKRRFLEISPVRSSDGQVLRLDRVSYHQRSRAQGAGTSASPKKATIWSCMRASPCCTSRAR